MTPALLKDPRQTVLLALSLLILALGCSTTALENSVARALKEKAYPWMQCISDSLLVQVKVRR